MRADRPIPTSGATPACRWLVVVPLVIGAACGLGGLGVEQGARQAFVERYTCPADRVEVRARDDLRYGDLMHELPPVRQPPAEVAADPERLALWEADRQEERDRIEDLRDRRNRLQIYEITGCGHRDVVQCEHPTTSTGPGETLTRFDVVECNDVPLARLAPASP